MKTVDSGYGNSGDLIQARRRAQEDKRFRYLIITTSGGTPGMIGGSFDYEIHGTNAVEELLKPHVIRQRSEIIDTRTGKEVKKVTLAKRYLNSLNREQKSMLVDGALLKFLTP